MSGLPEINHHIPLTVETLPIDLLHAEWRVLRRGQFFASTHHVYGLRTGLRSPSPDRTIVSVHQAVERNDQPRPNSPLPQISSSSPGTPAPVPLNLMEHHATVSAQSATIQTESDATYHQIDTVSPENNFAQYLGESLARPRRRALSDHPPSGVPERQPVKERSVHFENPDSSPWDIFPNPLPNPTWYASPMPMGYGAAYSTPQYTIPVHQPPGWPNATYGSPSVATPYVEPQQRPQSIYSLPFTDRGSIFNLFRSFHDIVLLGLPLLYHRRLARVREKADLPPTVVAWAKDPNSTYPFYQQRQFSVPPLAHASPQPPVTGVRQQAALRGYSTGLRVQWDSFRDEWESFVFASTQEWQTLNIISALLLSAILAILGIDDAGHNVITRTAALMALVSALMSLGFGGAYTIRFSSLKAPQRGLIWALETKAMTAPLIWNIWTFLSLPAAWLAWSGLFFCVTIASFVWTSGDRQAPLLDWDSNGGAGVNSLQLTNAAVLVPRVLVSALFLIGFVYAIQATRFLTRWAGLNASVEGDGKGDV